MSTATQPYDNVHGVRNYTFGQHLPFPFTSESQITGETLSGRHLIAYSIEGSADITSQVTSRSVASYRLAMPGIYGIYEFTIVAVNISQCPVDADCDSRGHSMLLGTLMGENDGTITVYDLPSLIMNNGTYNTTELTCHAGHTVGGNAVQNAVNNVAPSMHWNGTFASDRWPYAATVFDGSIDVHVHGDRVSHLTVPCGKRQITSGESLHLPSDDEFILTFLVGNADQMVWSYAGDVPASSVEPTEPMPADVDAMRAEIEVLREDRQNTATALDAARSTISNLRSIIDTAREACATATRNNGGCEEGKIGFLTSTGLWPDASEDDIAELAGCPRERDYDVHFTVTYNLMTTVRCTPDFMDDADSGDIESMMDSVADLVRENIYDSEVRIDDVEEA